MRYLLDTNVVIALSKGVPAVVGRLENCAATDIALSPIVMSEIEYGIAKSKRQEHNRRIFDAIMGGFPVVPFDAAAARHYGSLRAELESAGKIIGANDMLIAAQALALGSVLVTDNVREFSRIDGLLVENWLR
ncbi:PIN domain-containing protein [Aromatoleum toluvorans]|uniref:Ribonuclease VapC n=1 Tax=Aromatoleum toluvorans TaxID=92002 RepID=A0ABX1Q1M2_9RHOO|nr:type II toxin-antitoxin system VapC family toxin [Aromatoleum toluvorans]NMG45325.1 PIN domain-containing protein [Aromatoleum toluvorans]